MGSGVAVQLAAQTEPAAVILEAPFMSIEAVVKNVIKIWPTSILLKHKFRSDEFINEVSSPILIAYASEDRIVPFSQSESLYAIAPAPKHSRNCLLYTSDAADD